MSRPQPPLFVPATVKRQVQAEFPFQAAEHGFEGWIDVSFDVDPSGVAHDAIITGSSSAKAAEYFAKEALRVTLATTYNPATRGGAADWDRGHKRHYVFNLGDRQSR